MGIQTWTAGMVAGATMMALGSIGTSAADVEKMVGEPGYAATVSISGAFGKTDSVGINSSPFGGYDLSSIIGTGDFVLPVNLLWNIQMSGAIRRDWLDFDYGFNGNNAQALFDMLGFYRDPSLGLFGIDVGYYSTANDEVDEPRWPFIRVGGVAQWYPNEMFTLGAFGGALFGTGWVENTFDDGEGYYVGGNATWYASPNWAVGFDGRYLELSEAHSARSKKKYGSLRVGGNVRYLTSVPGLEIFAAGNYMRCDGTETQDGQRANNFVNDGFEFLMGMNIRLGGNSNSVVKIDRSNAVDTRVWRCVFDEGSFPDN